MDSAEPSEEVSEEAPEEVKVTPAPEVGSGESVEVPVVVEALQPIDLTIGAGDGGVISQMPDIVPAPQVRPRSRSFTLVLENNCQHLSITKVMGLSGSVG